jgi:hypothetical protein
MVRSLEINGSELKNIRSASELTGYSRDYITKLAREQKITASQIGRQWFVDVDSLSGYAKTVAEEQRLRNEQLSEERRRERQTVQKTTPPEKVSPTKIHSSKKMSVTLSSQMVAVGVLVMGLGFGFTLSQSPIFSTGFSTQVASTPLLQSIQGHSAELEIQDISGGAPVVFSHESVGLSTMEGSEKGILLLPQQGKEIGSPTELFSDEVKVLVDEHGNQFIARVDGEGEVVERIPFVRVPVTSRNTP